MTWVGISAMVAGTLALGGVFLDGRKADSIHILPVAVLALAVALILGGLQCIRWGIFTAKTREREQIINDDLFSIENVQGQMVEDIRKFIAAESTQSVRSAEARERLERMERLLLVLAAGVEDVRTLSPRLTAIEQGMTALARAVRETADQQSQEASAIEVRLDGYGRQLAAAVEMLAKISLEMPKKEEIIAEVGKEIMPAIREEMKAIAKAERAAGYVAGVQARPAVLNGTPDLHVVRRDSSAD